MLLLSTALAAPPAWDWPAEPVRFHLESRLIIPHGRTVYADRNDEADVYALKLTADVECLAEDASPAEWVVRCSFAHLSVTGTAGAPHAQAAVDEVLAGWTATLGRATAEFTQRRDGRVTGFALTGIRGTTQRETRVREAQRQIVQRAFAPFDLELPPEGDDWIRGWKERELGAAWYLPVGVGTAGIGAISFAPDPAPERTSSPEEAAAALFEIRYGGRATLAPGSSLDELTGTNDLDERKWGDATSTARMSGNVLFDRARGLPEWRGSQMVVYRNVAVSGVGNTAELLHDVALQRVDAFLPGGAAPPPVAALRAPYRREPPPETALAVVPFAELGMNALFVPSLPAEARQLGLTTVTVHARVEVGADGRVTRATMYDGYAALVEPSERALRGAAFPVRGAPYAVDVALEWRDEFAPQGMW